MRPARGDVLQSTGGEVRFDEISDKHLTKMSTVRSAVLSRQDWSLLRPALAAAGVDVAGTTASLRQYAELILRWNATVSNLMSRNDHSRIVERHLLESVDHAAWLKSAGAESWIDFGSGAGFPAIPLALCGVGTSWLLVDSRRSKVLFLTRTIGDLRLNGVTAIHARLETLAEDQANAAQFDGLTSRATALLPLTLKLAAPLVKAGGCAFLWKGSRRDEEIADDDSWKESWAIKEIRNVTGSQTAVCKFMRI